MSGGGAALLSKPEELFGSRQVANSMLFVRPQWSQLATPLLRIEVGIDSLSCFCCETMKNSLLELINFFFLSLPKARIPFFCFTTLAFRGFLLLKAGLIFYPRLLPSCRDVSWFNPSVAGNRARLILDFGGQFQCNEEQLFDASILASV